jgi:hypothetical protein
MTMGKGRLESADVGLQNTYRVKGVTTNERSEEKNAWQALLGGWKLQITNE